MLGLRRCIFFGLGAEYISTGVLEVSLKMKGKIQGSVEAGGVGSGTPPDRNRLRSAGVAQPVMLRVYLALLRTSSLGCPIISNVSLIWSPETTPL